MLKLFPETLVYSPNNLIEETTHLIKNNNLISNPVNKFKVIEAPGHTLDHIMLYDEENALLFCGDVLFRLGCGRVFEGTLNNMYSSLQKINDLNKDTLIYCGHEYTNKNGQFCISIDEENDKLKKRIKDVFNDNGRRMVNLMMNQLKIESVKRDKYIKLAESRILAEVSLPKSNPKSIKQLERYNDRLSRMLGEKSKDEF